MTRCAQLPSSLPEEHHHAMCQTCHFRLEPPPNSLRAVGGVAGGPAFSRMHIFLHVPLEYYIVPCTGVLGTATPNSHVKIWRKCRTATSFWIAVQCLTYNKHHAPSHCHLYGSRTMAISFKRTHNKAPPSQCKSLLLVLCVWISLCLIPLALLFEQTHAKTHNLKDLHHHHHSMDAIAPRHDTAVSSSSVLTTEAPRSDPHQLYNAAELTWSATNVSSRGLVTMMIDESNSSMISPG